MKKNARAADYVHSFVRKEPSELLMEKSQIGKWQILRWFRDLLWECPQGAITIEKREAEESGRPEK